MNSLVFNDFTHFMADIGTKLSVEGFLSGDISRADADTVCGLFVGLKTSQLTESRDHRGDLRLPSDHIINICARKMSHVNSVAKVCFQIGDELHIAVDTALLHLFSSLIRDDITAKLRFQEHLGYSVSGETDYDLGIFSFTIVSCDYNPEFLSLKIEDYVKNLGVFLKGVSDSVYEKRKGSIELSGEEESLWEHLSEQSPDGFNRSVTSCLKKIHKEDIIIFYNKWFLSKRPFSIRVWCCKLYSKYLDSTNAEN
ncbi:uncharacterized protein LOC108827116 [Raphanus sativus]|uniref:Uncharacterized protein LOC108827116 n=1 Tax=Raphanus sativus TaxID=3726 RepID=A0A9W3CDA6_RAPSA|nr:uncharacterized protein LOC108827116 [Raphanus sativus]